MTKWATYLFTIDVLLMLVGSGLWYWIKAINSSKGYEIDFLWHLGDFRHFAQIIAAEEDVDRRRKYKALLLALRLCTLSVVVITTSGAVLVWVSGV